MPADPSDDWTHRFTLDEWASRLATIPLTSDPGTRFEYGFGSDIAGALIEHVSGERLDAFLHKRVFSPLGLRDTDFSRFLQMLLERVLPFPYRDLMGTVMRLSIQAIEGGIR